VRSTLACLVVAAAFTAGCGGAAPTVAEDATSPHGIVPDGPVPYGHAETIDAGFLQASLTTRPCGRGLLGVALRILNTGESPYRTYQLDVTARRPGGEVLRPAPAPYDSPCHGDRPPEALAPGEATTRWLVYETPTPELRLRLEIPEPHGLATYRADVYLDQETVDRDGSRVARPTPPSPSLAIVEGPYFRLTVVDQHACGYRGSTTVRYEVVLESFSNVPIRLGLTKLVDGQGRTYSYRSVHYADPCSFASRGEGGGAEDLLDDVPPGGRRRGWLLPIPVGSGAKDLVLESRVMGNSFDGAPIRLALGALPKAVPAKDPFAPEPRTNERATAEPATAQSLHDALKPKPAPPPIFKDLSPKLKDPTTYEPAKVLTLFKEHHHQQGNFLMGVVPMTTELWAAGFYPKWKEKRYTTPQMVERTQQDFLASAEDKLFARLVLFHHADVMVHKGEHSLTVPDDMADYVFLELDGRPAIRCSEAQIPLMHLVGPFSKQVAVTLVFDLPPGVADRLENGKGKVRFVVGGLGFENNTFDYPLPLRDLTDDAPPELKKVFKAIAAAPRP